MGGEVYQYCLLGILSLLTACSSFSTFRLSSPRLQGADWQSRKTWSLSSTRGENLHLTHLEHANRVWCISDLHTDHKDNMRWLENLKSAPSQTVPSVGPGDIIVVAGDISDKLDRVEQSLAYLLDTGAEVLFLPGNHEAWLNQQELKTGSSLEKLDRVYETCQRVGVLTGPVQIGGTLERPNTLWIAPMESWYDGSLSIPGCEDLCDGFGRWPWVDFARCRWPGFGSLLSPNQKIPDGVAQFFADRNVRLLEQVEESVAQSNSSMSRAVMTVSHFLPNKQCLPDWVELDSPSFLRDKWFVHGRGDIAAKFAKVSGTELLDNQIRGLKLPHDCRRIHVFGHSHRQKDFEFEGVRYVHNPLGKPRERELSMIAPQADFQLVWDSREGEHTGETITRYWEEKAGGLEAFLKRLADSRGDGRYQRHAKLRHRQGTSATTSRVSIHPDPISKN